MQRVSVRPYAMLCKIDALVVAYKTNDADAQRDAWAAIHAALGVSYGPDSFRIPEMSTTARVDVRVPDGVMVVGTSMAPPRCGTCDGTGRMTGAFRGDVAGDGVCETCHGRGWVPGIGFVCFHDRGIAPPGVCLVCGGTRSQLDRVKVKTENGWTDR